MTQWIISPSMCFLARIKVLLVVSVAWAMPANGEDLGQGQFFNVRSAETALVDDVVRLNAEIEIHMSPQSKEALTSGVPLVFEIKIEVLREISWLWNTNVASLLQRYNLAYHALSQRYQVENLNTGVRRSFRSLRSALRMVGTLKDFPMLDRNILKADQSYLVRIRADLDIEALPTPIRVWAYSSPKWRLTSEWYQWRLQQ